MAAAKAEAQAVAAAAEQERAQREREEAARVAKEALARAQAAEEAAGVAAAAALAAAEAARRATADAEALANAGGNLAGEAFSGGGTPVRPEGEANEVAEFEKEADRSVELQSSVEVATPEVPQRPRPDQGKGGFVSSVFSFQSATPTSGADGLTSSDGDRATPPLPGKGSPDDSRETRATSSPTSAGGAAVEPGANSEEADAAQRGWVYGRWKR